MTLNTQLPIKVKALDVSIIFNDEDQALIVTTEEWTKPYPEVLLLKSNGKQLYIRNQDNYPLAIAPVSASIPLMSSKEVFLGQVKNEKIITVCEVQTRWP